LKNIGLGVANFENTRRVFPTGGSRYVDQPANKNTLEQNIENGRPFGPDKQGLGWGYQILSFVEETTAAQATTTAQLSQVVVPIYVCPSRRLATAVYSANFNGVFLAPMDYAAPVPCSFTSTQRTAKYDPLTAVPLSERSFQLVAPHYYGGFGGNSENTVDNKLYDGVIVRTPWLNSYTRDASGKMQGRPLQNVTGLVKMSEVIDGTSKTLLAGEKYVRNDNYTNADNLNSDDRGWADGWDADQMRSSCFPPMNDADPLGFDPVMGRMFGDKGPFPFGGMYNVLHFGSAHTAGINVAFVDGAVRMIAYGVDPVVFNSLGTRNGEESIPTDRSCRMRRCVLRDRTAGGWKCGCAASGAATGICARARGRTVSPDGAPGVSRRAVQLAMHSADSECQGVRRFAEAQYRVGVAVSLPTPLTACQ
jgi:hypothetical protein